MLFTKSEYASMPSVRFGSPALQKTGSTFFEENAEASPLAPQIHDTGDAQAGKGDRLALSAQERLSPFCP